MLVDIERVEVPGMCAVVCADDGELLFRGGEGGEHDFVGLAPYAAREKFGDIFSCAIELFKRAF